MNITKDAVITQPLMSEDLTDGVNFAADDDETEEQVTPQTAIDLLSRYTIRPDKHYSHRKYKCSICYRNYSAGDRIICLPCQHNFHEYCIENWLKWVKPTCPVDKKSISHREYVKDVIEERQNRFREAYMRKMQSINCDDKSSSSCESAVKISSSIPESPLKKHRKRTEIKLQPKELLPFSPGSIASQRIKRNELEYTPSSSTILEIEKEISLQEKINDWQERNTKLQNPDSNLSRKDKDQLKKSVDAIRRSIKSKDDAVVKKNKTPPKFHKELDFVINKLSAINANSPKRITRSVCKRRDCKNILGNALSPNRKEFQQLSSVLGNTGSANLTFGDILEIENESNLG